MPVLCCALLFCALLFLSVPFSAVLSCLALPCPSLSGRVLERVQIQIPVEVGAVLAPREVPFVHLSYTTPTGLVVSMPALHIFVPDASRCCQQLALSARLAPGPMAP